MVGPASKFIDSLSININYYAMQVCIAMHQLPATSSPASRHSGRAARSAGAAAPEKAAAQSRARWGAAAIHDLPGTVTRIHRKGHSQNRLDSWMFMLLNSCKRNPKAENSRLGRVGIPLEVLAFPFLFSPGSTAFQLVRGIDAHRSWVKREGRGRVSPGITQPLLEHTLAYIFQGGVTSGLNTHQKGSHLKEEG